MSAYEYFVQAGMMLCGSCVWAYVIGSCCGILATLNPALLEYRQQLDELKMSSCASTRCRRTSA